MLRAILGTAAAVLVIGASLASAEDTRPPRAPRCAADAPSCARPLPPVRAVVTGTVEGRGPRPATIVLGDLHVTGARPAVRRQIRRAGTVEVVVRETTAILVRDEAGEEGEAYAQELLDAAEAGVPMEARVAGRVGGTARRPVVRASRVVVEVEDIGDILPAEDDEPADEPVDEGDPGYDDPPADAPAGPDAPPDPAGV